MKSFNRFNRNILLAGYIVQRCCLVMVNTFSLSVCCYGIIVSRYDKGLQLEKCWDQSLITAISEFLTRLLRCPATHLVGVFPAGQVAPTSHKTINKELQEQNLFIWRKGGFMWKAFTVFSMKVQKVSMEKDETKFLLDFSKRNQNFLSSN